MAYTQAQAMEVAGIAMKSALGTIQEPLASFDRNQVEQALTSWTRLHAQDKLLSHLSSDIDPEQNFKESFSFWKDHLLETFIRLYDEGKLVPLAPLSASGELVIKNLQRKFGSAQATPIEKPLTPVERLEAEVISDFTKLRSADFRERLNESREYRVTFDRLASEGGRLGTNSVTADWR